MLNGFALSLMNLSEGALVLFSILLIVSGFVFGLVLRRGATLSMPRVPYFVWTALVYGLISAMTIAWLLTFVAVQNGVLWLLVLFIYGAIFVSGMAYAILGHARSVSAYGSGRNAWMAIIPLANLVLYFKRPIDWSEGNSGSTLKSVLGIILGLFIVIVGAGIGRIAEDMIATMASDTGYDDATYSATIDMLIQSQGLGATLTQMAADFIPQRVDEVTMLTRVEADGETLRYLYDVSSEVGKFDETDIETLRSRICEFTEIRPIILAGATVEHVYRLPDGSVAGTVVATRELCGL